MKTRVRNEQKRCRAAELEESFVLIFCFFLIQTKEKHQVVETFNLRIYFENFTKNKFVLLNDKKYFLLLLILFKHLQ